MRTFTPHPYNTIEKLKELNKPVLSVEEAAEIIGVSKGTVHTWREKGLLKTYKLTSRFVAIMVEDLINFLEREADKEKKLSFKRGRSVFFQPNEFKTFHYVWRTCAKGNETQAEFILRLVRDYAERQAIKERRT